jgi:hypothetical protein
MVGVLEKWKGADAFGMTIMKIVVLSEVVARAAAGLPSVRDPDTPRSKPA